MTSFPWRHHNEKELNKNFFNLKKKLNSININDNDLIPYFRNGVKCSNFFFQKERLNTPSQDKKSCVEFWKLNEDKIKAYNKKSWGNDFFTTIVFMNHAPSQFPPVTAGCIYKLFNAKKILDPFAGWGDRCISAIALNLDYIGIDSNPNLLDCYNNLIKFFQPKSKIQIIFNKSQEVNLDELDFNFVFSSPPFYNKQKTKLLEEYNNTDNNNYETFITSLVDLIKKIKNKKHTLKDIWVCFHLPLHMYEDIKNSIGECKKILKFFTNSNTTKNPIQYVYCF
jgi:16S rRNA G966 N2-methylase RsmD